MSAKGRQKQGSADKSAWKKNNEKNKRRAGMGSSEGGNWWEMVALVAFVVLLVYPPYLRGLFFPKEQEWTLLLAGLVFTATWIWRHQQRQLELLSRPLDYTALGLILVYAASVISAASYRLAVGSLVQIMLYFLIYWMMSRLANSEKRVRFFLHVIYLNTLALASTGFLTGMGVLSLRDGFVSGRVFSTLQYPNALASYLAAVSVVGFFLWLAAPKGLRLAYAAGNYYLLLIFLGTSSRGAFLVYPLILLLYFVFLPRGRRFVWSVHFAFTAAAALIGSRWITLAVQENHSGAWQWFALGAAAAIGLQLAVNILAQVKPRTRWVVIGVLALLCIVLLATAGLRQGTVPTAVGDQPPSFIERIVPEHLIERVKNINLQQSSSQDRLLWTRDAFRLIGERPVLGYGGGGWEAAYRSVQSFRYSSTEVHNDLVQLWVEVGTVGLIIYLGIWAFFLWSAAVAYIRREGAQKILPLSLGLAGLSLGIHSLLDFDLALGAVSILLWSFFGLAGALERLGDGAVKPVAYHKRVNKQTAAVVAIAVIALLFPVFLLAGRSNAEKGVAALNRQDLAGAENAFRQATVYDPFNADNYQYLALIHRNKGNRDMALDMAQKATARDRFNPTLYLRAAEAAWEAGRFEQSLKFQEQSKKTAPMDISVYEQLAGRYVSSGMRHLQLDELEQAGNQFRQVLAIPEEIDRVVKGVAPMEMDNWKESGKPLLQVTPLLQLYQGMAAYFFQDWRQAEASLRPAEQDASLQYDAAFWLALLMEQQGRKERAQSYLAKAVQGNAQLNNQYGPILKLPLLEQK
ncbi:MAG: O-antigen ligase family protein [Bacillota bacterium]